MSIMLKYGIPFIFMILAFPAMIFLFLQSNRDSLNDQEIIEKHGFLYIGLKEEAILYEIPIFFFKLLLIYLNLSMKNGN